MPTYDYICKECGTKFSVSGSYSTLSTMNTNCPNCKSQKIRKIFSILGIVFKGKGFYSTDNPK